MANYSRNYEITLTETKAVYNETPIVFNEGDYGTSKINILIKKENKVYDLTGLTAKLYVKTESGEVIVIDDADSFENGEENGKLLIKLSKEILDKPSKYVAQVELHDTTDNSVYSFQTFEFEIVNRFYNN